MQACIALFTGTILPYYCKYIFLDDSLYSILFLVETFTTILATILFCPRLLKRFGKRNMSLYGIVLAFLAIWPICWTRTVSTGCFSAASSAACALLH